MGNKRPSGRSTLYIVCAFLYPLAFAAFVVGFGCPAWYIYPSSLDKNAGLWQECSTVFKSCNASDFADRTWMAGVRGVEIFALVMVCLGLTQLVYENACTGLHARLLGERLAVAGFSLLTGLGGLAGIIVYVINMDDAITGDATFGWALALVAAGSGLMVVLAVGFFIHGCFLEKKKHKDKDPSRMNGHAYVSTHDENYELNAYTNRGMTDDDAFGRKEAPRDNLPGFALYNGPLTRPGDRFSLPGPGTTASAPGPGPSMFENSYPNTTQVLPPFPANPRYSPPQLQKASQYYSVSDDRLMDPGFDLSEGYKPPGRSVRTTERPYSRNIEDPYSRRPEDPYSRRLEDPYSRRVEDPYSRRGEDPYLSRQPEKPYSSRLPESPYVTRASGDPYPSRAAENPYSSRPTSRSMDDAYNRLNRYENPPPARPFNRDSYYRGAAF